MRFLVDEALAAEVAERLSERGHDAVHVLQIGLGGARDELILERATSEGRVLLTADLDFGEIAQSTPSPSACVVIFRMQRRKPEIVVHRLLQVLAQDGDSLRAGTIASVDGSRHRISISRREGT